MHGIEIHPSDYMSDWVLICSLSAHYGAINFNDES